MRFHHRYGIRVPLKEAEAAQTQLNPESAYAHFEITKVFELRPLPHGTQKSGIYTRLKSWKWQAKPLQPCKSDATGMGWLVGASSDPPGRIMWTNAGDVMVSLHKDTTLPPTSTTSITSLGKTQAFLRKQQKAGSSKDTKTIQAPPGLTDDPWTVHDPWKSWQGARPSTDVPMPATRSMAEHLEEKMQQQVVASVKDNTGARLLVEIKHQQGKFETWFQEAGAANDLLQTQVRGWPIKSLVNTRRRLDCQAKRNSSSSSRLASSQQTFRKASPKSKLCFLRSRELRMSDYLSAAWATTPSHDALSFRYLVCYDGCSLSFFGVSPPTHSVHPLQGMFKP